MRFGAEKKSAPDTDTVSQDSPCKRRHRLLYGYAGIDIKKFLLETEEKYK